MPFFVTSFIITGNGALVGAVLAGIASLSWRRYRAASSYLVWIRAVPFVCVSDLSSLLEIDDSAAKAGGLLVFVRGEIQTQPSTLELWLGLKNHGALVSECCDGRRAVIIDESDVSQSDGFGFLKPYLTSRNWVPFGLVDSARIHSDFLNVSLTGVHTPLPLDPCEHVRYAKFPVPPFLWRTSGDLGERRSRIIKESILPVGEEITAAGTCRVVNGTLVIMPSDKFPCYLSRKIKKEIVDDLSKVSNIYFWSTISIGTMSVGILGYAIYRHFKRRKEARLRDEIRQAKPRVGLRFLL